MKTKFKKILLIFGLFLILIPLFQLRAADAPITRIDNPLRWDTPEEIIGNVIKAVLGIIGAIALVMFLWGGFQWMTSGGSSERVKKGRDTLVWATIGLLVIFTSYAILYFIFEAIGVE